MKNSWAEYEKERKWRETDKTPSDSWTQEEDSRLPCLTLRQSLSRNENFIANREYCYGYASIYISFREWTPLPMWVSEPTVDPENWRTYSYCDTAEGTKQTAQLYYWFRVTTVFLDDFNGTFQHVCMILCPKECPEILKFSCPDKSILCPGLHCTKVINHPLKPSPIELFTHHKYIGT